MTDYSALAHFGDYNPADFGWAARDPESDPSLLVPFNYRDVSFGDMHVDVVRLFTALLDQLVPLIPGSPNPVAGECGCFNPSSVTVAGDRSFHTYATAIDVNWSQNPMFAAAMPTGPHALPHATSAIARSFGCEWGGDWTYPQDWMHIEVHLSPDVARTVTGGSPPIPKPTEDDDMPTAITAPNQHVPMSVTGCSKVDFVVDFVNGMWVRAAVRVPGKGAAPLVPRGSGAFVSDDPFTFWLGKGSYTANLPAGSRGLSVITSAAKDQPGEPVAIRAY